MGNGYLLNVRNKKRIKYKSEYAEKNNKYDIMLLLSGHGSKINKKSYYEDYPVIDNTSAERPAVKRIKMLGMDSPSPDIYPFNIHKLLLNEREY